MWSVSVLVTLVLLGLCPCARALDELEMQVVPETQDRPSRAVRTGDGLSIDAVRGAAEAGPGTRVGALFRSVVVPGYGQCYNGQQVKGGLFLGAEVALLGTALAFHLAGDGALQLSGQQARAQASADSSGRAQQLYGLAAARYRVRDALLLAATGLWAINVIDAYLSGGRGQPVLVDRGIGERALAPLAAIRPGSALLGVQGRF